MSINFDREQVNKAEDVKTSRTRMVISALENPNSDWRTIQGVSEETHLSPEEMEEIIRELELSGLVIKSSISDKQGRPLYTTKTHYNRRKDEKIKLSDSVSNVRNALLHEKDVTAKRIVAELLKHHMDDYASGRARGIDLNEESSIDERKPVDDWIQAVSVLYDPSRLDQRLLNGKLLILGLSLLDEKLAQELATNDFLKTLQEQYRPPFDSLLTPSARQIRPSAPIHNRSLLATYDADTTDGHDLLGIEGDVNAFASLIATRTISPPLSIGLFGDWGSGKTFFLRRLQRRVQEIADSAHESGKLQKDISFYKRIAQIEFNAWQFAESTLWASLVEHIFANLHVSRDDDEGAVQARQEHLLRQLETEQVALSLKNEEVKKAEQERDEAQAELKTLLHEHAREIQRLNDSRELAKLSAADMVGQGLIDIPEDAQKTLEESGISTVEVGKSAKDFYNAVTDFRAVLQHSNSVLTPLVYAKDRSKRFWLLVLLTLAAPLLGLLLGGIISLLGGQGIATVSGIISGAIVFLTTATAWLRNQTAWVSHQIETFESANRRIDDKVAAKRAEYNREETEAQQNLKHLETGLKLEKQKEEEQQRRIGQLQAELAETEPTRLLARFIQDRADSKDYRKHLGLLALVRRDFERLTAFLEEENRSLESYESLTDEEKNENLRINRVVLYIDDLDRCPSPVVVRVLQAVHMLLAFPLFVVVVAVDARWVSQSLRMQYPDLLALEENSEADEAGLLRGREATPHDYLEKIFQIPFWIEPMSEPSTKGLLEGLLRTSLIVERPDDRLNSEDGTSGSGSGTSNLGGSKHLADSDHQKTNDLNPDRFTIAKIELDFMEHLAPLLGRSPRAVKRFVNVYRLIKAAIPRTEQVSFVQEQGLTSDFRSVMLLLGIITGMPSLSQPLLRVLLNPLHDTDGNKGQMNTLDEVVHRLDVSDSVEQQAERARLSTWLDRYQDGHWRTEDVASLRKWAPRVARFSFWGPYSHITSDGSLLS